MFLVDDLIKAPAKGLMFIARRVQDAVEEEITGREEELKSELHDQYMLLELGEITPEEFDEREEEILDQLEALEEAKKELQGAGDTPGRAPGGNEASTDTLDMNAEDDEAPVDSDESGSDPSERESVDDTDPRPERPHSFDGSHPAASGGEPIDDEVDGADQTVEADDRTHDEPPGLDEDTDADPSEVDEETETLERGQGEKS